ncbi:MAG: hypothetical protein JRG90_22100, partial [Deltaproteobacteria bacterium]|nr:hypothetical protein [Deltaproteobacteria bacterium]
MSTTRLEHFRSEIRRIRESIADAVHHHTRKEGNELRLSPSPEHRHVVPPRLTILDVMEGELAT